MEKSFIKNKLRESLFSRIKEAGKTKSNEENSDDENSNKEGGGIQGLNTDEKEKVQTLTTKIKNATQGAGKLLKLSQVMDAAGVGNADNATDRSAIGKAVSGKPDADGKKRHLSISQANAMAKVVDNPVAYKK
jgi:hypothetical protein